MTRSQIFYLSVSQGKVMPTLNALNSSFESLFLQTEHDRVEVEQCLSGHADHPLMV